MIAGFLTAELLIAVGYFNSHYRPFLRQMLRFIERCNVMHRCHSVLYSRSM